jgi:putative flippase GtrA
LARTFATLARHQLGSLVSTAVDFATMIVLVSGLGLGAVLATALGAAAGGVTNFVLGRTWIFRAHEAPAGGQAVRYFLVSGASLGWNALGEYLLHDRLRLQYVVARAIVAVAVSLLWNFPMHRGFVFGTPRARGAATGPSEPT